MVVQPPFSMTDRRFHDEILLNSTNFAGASAWCWNFSTQIGASTATTAVSARWVAIRSAVLPRGPSERREPHDRQYNSAGHCTPYRWFHSGMDFRFRPRGSGRSELLLFPPKNHIERRAAKC